MYKFPLRIPADKKITVTQKFKSKELLDFYASKGIKMQFHDAIDVAVGGVSETHGTPFVCPFPVAKCIYFDDSGETGSPKADRVQIEYVDSQGNVIIMGGLHFSKMIYRERYLEGETIAYLGNSGYVLPEPTTNSPLSGSHLHLTTIVNGKVVDPETIFDITNPYRGEDTGDSFDVNELIKGRITLAPASESIALFAKTLPSWKAAVLMTLAKWLQSIGY